MNKNRKRHIKKQVNNFEQLSLIKFRKSETDSDLDIIDLLIKDIKIENVFHDTVSCIGRKPYNSFQIIRAHILKAVKKIPSYNILCKELRNHKSYRNFCKLKNKKKSLSPGTLSNFRKKVTDKHIIKLMLVFIHQAVDFGLFDNSQVWIADSTDIESPCSGKAIDTIIEDRKKKELFTDKTARKGRRSVKKCRTRYYIGHKKHSLMLVLPDGNKAISLLSLVSPADCHDSNYLMPLIDLALSLGLKIKYVVCDLAYIDETTKAKAFEKGALVITDKKSNSLMPLDTDEKTGTPLCLLGEPMKWLGYNPDFKEHYYGCSLQNPSECICSGTCLKERIINYEEFPHSFNVIPAHCSLAKKFLKTRKLCESGFWRNKYNEGLYNMTLMGQHNVLFMSCIADICGILTELKSSIINKKFIAA